VTPMEQQRFTIRLDTKELVKDTLARTFYVISLVVILMMTGAIGLFWKVLPRVIPLYYSLPWGEARLAPKIQLFILPIVGLVVVVMNVVVGKILKLFPVLLARMLGVSALVIVILLLLSEVGILQSII
jgi:hypothetical protein